MACLAGAAARPKRPAGCLDDGLLMSAVQEYAQTAERNLARLFEFGSYADIAMTDKADVPGLAALASLLGPLLKAAPRGVINQGSLASAFAQVLAAKGIPARTCTVQAEIAAGRARTALSHLRRLLQQPTVRAQRSKTASRSELAAIEGLAELYCVGPVPVPRIPESWENPGRDGALLPSSSVRGPPSPPLSPAPSNPDDLPWLPSLPPSPLPSPPPSLPHRPAAPRLPTLDVPTTRPAPAPAGALAPVESRPAASAAPLRDAVNAILDAACRSQPAAQTTRAQAASHALPAAGPAQAAPAQAAKYYILSYYSSSACGCRAKGGRQLFQVRVAGDMSEARRIAEGGRDRLLRGDSLDAVTAWVTSEKLAAVAAAASVSAD